MKKIKGKTIGRLALVAASLCVSAASMAQVSASADRYSPQSAGYLERARAMSNGGNYAGVIDQLRHLNTQNIRLSDTEAVEYTFLLAKAYYERGDKECITLLKDFREQYPASPLAPEALRAIGDFYFFNHQWSDALTAYNEMQISRFNRDDKVLYSYRKALAQIKTGHYKEARPLLRELEGAKGYGDALNFYTGYLDYIDGNFNSAYDLFSKVSPGVEGLESGYYMTQIEYSRGEYSDVIKHGRSLLFKHPVPELVPELQRVVGLSYFKLGEYIVARQFLLNYEENSKSGISEDAAYAIGVADYVDGDYEKAAERFGTLADNEGPLGQSAWLYLGQCALQRGDTSEAAIAFEKAVRRNYDKNVEEAALYNYVTAVTRGGKVPFASSADLLERFIDQYPDSEFAPEVETYLATAYYNDHNYTKALSTINGIKNPTKDDLTLKQKALYELGVNEITNGNTEKGAGYLRQAVDLHGGDSAIASQAALWLGDAYYTLHNYAGAEKEFKRYLSGAPAGVNTLLAYYNLGYAQYKQEHYGDAAKSFEKALSQRASLPEALDRDARLRRADCLYYTGNYAPALALYNTAVEQKGEGADYALYRRAIIEGLNGNVQKKVADLTLLQKDYPDSRWLSKGLLELALTYEDMGQSGKASDAYKKRLQVAESIDIDELMRMLSTMHDSKRWSDVLEVTGKIKNAGGLEPDEMADVMIKEADALEGLKRGDEAVAIYEELAQNPSSLPGAKSAVLFAEALLKRGEAEKAAEMMEEFTDAGTPHQYWLARGYITLADAMAAQGKQYLAKEYLQSLKENYPGTESDIASMITTRLNKWK